MLVGDLRDTAQENPDGTTLVDTRTLKDLLETVERVIPTLPKDGRVVRIHAKERRPAGN